MGPLVKILLFLLSYCNDHRELDESCIITTLRRVTKSIVVFIIAIVVVGPYSYTDWKKNITRTWGQWGNGTKRQLELKPCLFSRQLILVFAKVWMNSCFRLSLFVGVASKAIMMILRAECWLCSWDKLWEEITKGPSFFRTTFWLLVSPLQFCFVHQHLHSGE